MISGQFGIYDNIASSLQGVISYGTSLMVPESPFLALVGVGAWMYGRSLAITYAPGILANHFIEITVVFMKSTAVGKAVGTAVTAPLLTPQVLPYVVDLSGLAVFALVVVTGNLALRYLFKKQTENTNEEPVLNKT